MLFDFLAVLFGFVGFGINYILAFFVLSLATPRAQARSFELTTASIADIQAAVDGLLALGFTEAEVDHALSSADNGLDEESLIRHGLAALGRARA